MKHLNRWVYAGVGVLIMLFSGVVYAWTVLQAPITAMYPCWTKGQLSLTFTITMICFCLGGFLGSVMRKRFRPRVLVWVSAALFLLGFFVSSRAESLIALYLGFGLLSGLATGIVYNAVMGTVSCWFPDRQGFISGLLLMGFGMSSFIIGKVYTELTPTDGSALWRGSFIVIGVILFAALALSGFFVVKPDSAPGKKVAKTSCCEVSTKQMLGKASFWLYSIWATFLTAAGLAIISQGAPMALEACPCVAMDTVATVVGLISIFNGVGRIVFGALFDRVGHFWTMLAVGLVFIAAMLLLLAALKVHNIALLVAAYVITGLAYGGVPPTNSAFVNMFYGERYYPANLSIVNMCVLIASFGSTIAGAVFDATRSYTVIIAIVMGLVALGTTVSCSIRGPVETQEG